MINVDFKKYFRERIWFGWRCAYVVHLEDGSDEGTWLHTMHFGSQFIPVRLNRLKMEHLKEDIEAAQAGMHVYIAFNYD